MKATKTRTRQIQNSELRPGQHVQSVTLETGTTNWEQIDFCYTQQYILTLYLIYIACNFVDIFATGMTSTSSLDGLD